LRILALILYNRVRVRLERWSFVALYEPFELVFATALGGRLLCLYYNFDTVTRFAHHSNHLFQTNLAPALWCARPLTHYRYLRSQAISSRVTLPFFALLLSLQTIQTTSTSIIQQRAYGLRFLRPGPYRPSANIWGLLRCQTARSTRLAASDTAVILWK
jgi:hypothetical protein